VHTHLIYFLKITVLLVGRHLSLVLISVICWLNVTNSSIHKKGTTPRDKHSKKDAQWSALGKKQTDKTSLRSKIQKAKTVIANKLTRHVPLNGKEKRFLRELVAKEQRTASSTEGTDYTFSFGSIFGTESFVGDLLSLESEDYDFNGLDWSAIFGSDEDDYDEGLDELDGLGTSVEIKRLFRKWNEWTVDKQSRSKTFTALAGPTDEASDVKRSEDGTSNEDKDELRITPVDGRTINPADFPELKEKAENYLIQSATLDKKLRNPWVQISNDSIDLAQTTTLETSMLTIWQKDTKTDCGLKESMAICAKALIEINEFVAKPSDGADYILGMDYFKNNANKENYCTKKVTKCQDSVFSDIDGWCNNLNYPDWGGKNIPYRRLLKQNFYKEHISVPFSEADGLPNPLDVSQKLMTNEKEDLSWEKESRIVDPDLSQVFMQMGQFLTHDITQATFEATEPKVCKNKAASKFCRTFGSLSKDKFFFSSLRVDANMCAIRKDSDLILTEQVNGYSAFIDATTVYAESKDSSSHRTCRGKHGKMVDGECGDFRCQVTPLLYSCHFLFVAEHNRIVKGLIKAGMNLKRKYNGMEGKEAIFQIARKIVIAEIQSIVYGDWLPLLIGPTYMKRFELEVKSSASVYDPQVNPGMYNEFTTAAFRFGHSAIPGLYNARGKMKHLLNTHLFKVNVAGSLAINYPELLHGASLSPMEKIDTIVTNHMRGGQVDFIGGSDLAAVNIARGRDHGLPPYYKVREHFHFSPIFDKKQFEPDVLRKLKELYKDARYFGAGELEFGPRVADLWVAGLAEKHTPGGKVGETFASIIGQQFHNLKYGDRYFFTHTKENHGQGLPSKLRNMISKRTLGDIICDNRNSKFGNKIKEDVFRYNSKLVSCGSLGHDLDFGQIISELGFE